MRVLPGLLTLALLLPGAARADEEEDRPAVRRNLVNLKLGDTLETVKRIYPPAQEWPSYVEPRGRVTRYRIERDWMKKWPESVQTLHLGFKRGRLVEIQVVYDEELSREQPYEKLAGQYALDYGRADGRTGSRFWWADARTVLRVFAAKIPALDKDGKGEAVEFRTAVQIFEKGLFERVD